MFPRAHGAVSRRIRWHATALESRRAARRAPFLCRRPQYSAVVPECSVADSGADAAYDAR